MTCAGELDESIRQSFINTAEQALKHPPSQSWAVMMISTMNQAHEIFAKDWQKPRISKVMRAQTHAFVPAFGDFFEGLPMQHRTKRAGKLNFISKQQQQVFRVQRLEEQLSKARA